MKRKILLTIMFIVVTIFLVFQNKIYEGNIIEDTKKYATENLIQVNNIVELYYELIEEYLEHVKIKSLQKVRLSELELLNHDEILDELKNYLFENELQINTYIILENGKFYDINGETGDIDKTILFKSDELEAIKKLYSKIKLSLEQEKVTIKGTNINDYKRYVGQVIINDSNEFVGIKVAEESEKFIIELLNEYDERAIKFAYAIENAGEEYASQNFEINAAKNGTITLKGTFMLDDIAVKCNLNLLTTYLEFYSFRIVLILLLPLFAFYLLKIIKKEDKYIRISTLIIFVSVAITGMVGNIVVKNVTQNKINNSRIYSLCNFTDVNEKYEFVATVSILEKHINLLYDEIRTNEIYSLDVIKQVLNNDNFFKDYLNNDDKCSYVYLYDENQNQISLPAGDYMKYIKPSNISYQTETYKNENYFYEYKYDENFNNSMYYLSFPLIENNQVKMLISFVYDGKLLRNKILKLYSSDSFEKILIGKDNKIHKYEGYDFEYTGKETTQKIETERDLIFELLNKSVEYDEDVNKISKQKNVWSVKSVYLYGQVLMFENESKMFETTLTVGIFVSIIIMQIVIMFLHNYNVKNEENRITFKDELKNNNDF